MSSSASDSSDYAACAGGVVMIRSGLMRLVFVAQGSYGDIIPLLCLAKSAVARGYSVTFISYSYFEGYIVDRCPGVDFRAICSDDLYRSMVHTDQLLSDDEYKFHHFKSCAQYAIAPVFRNIQQISSVENCLLVGLKVCVGAVWAALAFDIPFVRIILSPSELEVELDETRVDHAADEESRSILDKVARDLNVQFDRSVGLIYPVYAANICLFPQAFLPSSKRRLLKSGRYVFSGFPLKSGSKSCVMLGPPSSGYFVYTCGTAFSSSLEEVDTFAWICAKFGVRGFFLSKNRNFDAATLGYTHVSVVDFCDLPALVEGAEIILHHGGIGTIADAVRARVPQLILPRAFDQFDNAKLIQRLGLGYSFDFREFKKGSALLEAINVAIGSRARVHRVVALERLDQYFEENFLNEAIRCGVANTAMATTAFSAV